MGKFDDNSFSKLIKIQWTLCAKGVVGWCEGAG